MWRPLVMWLRGEMLVQEGLPRGELSPSSLQLQAPPPHTPDAADQGLPRPELGSQPQHPGKRGASLLSSLCHLTGCDRDSCRLLAPARLKLIQLEEIGHLIRGDGAMIVVVG